MNVIIRNFLVSALVVLALALVALVIFVYSGVYYIGADRPHTRPVLAMMHALRTHSVRSHARGVEVPDLEDPARLREGAGHYDAMCRGCHLAPGHGGSEMRAGLYPKPPDLTRERIEPAEAFWVIKHGIKMSAMPAWGRTHDDAKLWSLVAFVRKLPGMTPQQYQALVAQAPADEDEDEHQHGHGGMH